MFTQKIKHLSIQKWVPFVTVSIVSIVYRLVARNFAAGNSVLIPRHWLVLVHLEILRRRVDLIAFVSSRVFRCPNFGEHHSVTAVLFVAWPRQRVGGVRRPVGTCDTTEIVILNLTSSSSHTKCITSCKINSNVIKYTYIIHQ